MADAMRLSDAGSMRTSDSDAMEELKLSMGSIDGLFRSSSELAALPLPDPNTLPEPKTLPSVTTGHELVGSSEDWQTVATTDTGLTKSFENAMQIQAGDTGAVCSFERHHSAVAGRRGSVRVQERPFSRVSWCVPASRERSR